MKKVKSFIRIILVITYFASSVKAQQPAPAISKCDSGIDYRDIKVVNVFTTNHKRITNGSVINDYIAVKIDGFEKLVKDTVSSNSQIVLMINGAPCPDITCYDIDYKRHAIIFHLDSSATSLRKIKNYVKSRWEKYVFSEVSIRYKKHPLESIVKNYNLYFTSPFVIRNCIFIFGIITLLLILLIRKTNIMRQGDQSTPYSLAQSQLTFWTLVIFIAVCYIWYETNELPILPTNILILMGITIGTTLGSKYINIDGGKGDVIITKPAKNFFIDIMSSDNNGTNIHRLQMVIWTCMLGFIFMIKVLSDLQLYNIDETYLYLTGISNGTYILLKTLEKKEPPIVSVPQN